MTAPHVFISYSRDSAAHIARVLEFAKRLRQDGVDAQLDQYEVLPSEGWIAWTERMIMQSDFVLAVCTDTYLGRIDGEEENRDSEDAAPWEGRLIRQHLYSACSVSGKFIPILFTGGSPAQVPAALKGMHTYRVETPEGYEELYRLLTDQNSSQFSSLEAAKTRGRTADMLQTRGNLDAALSIYREEQLPVYERLGEARAAAVTKGKIADIIQKRGEIDEALRIWREQLLVFERFGDIHSRAITMGKIADILQARGQLDEALRIRREGELPVYERLRDVRSRAITMGKIADILQARGQLDEALRIRREEELPVYERLGDVRSRAVTMGQIADILQARGQLDEALAIRKEEELPVYERLGDVRSRAVTMGQIADILQARGQLDEALRIRQEEELPVYERLGDVRSRAVTMGKVADILQARGQLDEALRMHLDRLPIAEVMGDADSIAHIKFCCARIRLERGDWEKGEAQTIADELAESFTIAQRMGRADFIAVIGGLFGQVLAGGGLFDDSIAVLDEAARAFETLGRSGDLTAIRSLQFQVRTMA